MDKYFGFKVAAFAAISTLVALTSGFAVTTGSISLSGVVSSILEITISPDAGNGSLPLTSDVNDRQVASVNERSNNRLGYTVTLSSESALKTGGQAALMGAVSSDSLPYSIKYGGASVNFASGSAVVSSPNAKTGALGSDKALTVSYSGSSFFLDADSYSDTLTLTIAAK
jgi:hypothetical protein